MSRRNAPGMELINSSHLIDSRFRGTDRPGRGWVRFAVLFLLLLSGLVSAQGLTFNGYVRNYTAVLLQGDNEYSIVQNTLNLNLEHSRDMVALKANPFIYQYPDKEMQIGLREAYMDIFFESVDIRIGKQQIIWGKADGVFITDIVSPKDLSEFLLRDFDEIRMGVTSAKFDYYLGDNTFELVWLPVFSPTLMPGKETIWFPQMDFQAPPNIPLHIDIKDPEAIKGSLENSELFAKYSAMTSLVDFEIMAGYAWDDDPTMHITQTMDTTGLHLLINPRYHRLGIAGGSFSTTLGPVVMRGEGAYYAGKYFNTTDPMAKDKLVKKDYLHYLVGLDYSLWEIKLSAQFIQQAILDYEKEIDQDDYENTVTFLARRDFLRETLTLELFSYIGLNNEDALIRPRILYDLTDGFEVQLGANIFTGSSGNFGQYDDNDMVYAKFKYSF